eukprot:CAMPEP_0176422996 /NCGR_PEP_ID=MMETSP0127-20121128/10038_1 /TAXON_ID=938130 /ORGANISM="Platyophrya macrostoma, Strain WH" /LENGTH=282 /DNA_ID=CAMNT_0017803897 /DNA_START=51 /DNA_END=899 /DNA_ORIENTATION=+
MQSRLLKLVLLAIALVGSFQEQVFLSQDVEDTEAAAGSASSYISGLKLTSLSISADTDSNAIIKFVSSAGTSLMLALLADSGSFVIENSLVTLVEVQESGPVIISASTLQVPNVNYYGNFSVGGVNQWKLFHRENFWNTPTGWTINNITTCGGLNLLGGYGILSQSAVLNKTFSDIPEHSSIRIISTFHYIDAWTGETAYLIANAGANGADAYLWVDSYDSTDAAKNVNVCGSSYGEGKFSTAIDLALPHTTDSITLSFGSTADQDPYSQSWGISALDLYII